MRCGSRPVDLCAVACAPLLLLVGLSSDGRRCASAEKPRRCGNHTPGQRSTTAAAAATTTTTTTTSTTTTGGDMANGDGVWLVKASSLAWLAAARCGGGWGLAVDQSQAAQDASDCLCLVEAHDRDGLPFRHSEACLRLGHLFVAPSGGRSPVQLARQRGLPLPPRYSAERSKRATLRDDQDEARGWFRRAAALGSGEGATRMSVFLWGDQPKADRQRKGGSSKPSKSTTSTKGFKRSGGGGSGGGSRAAGAAARADSLRMLLRGAAAGAQRRF